MKKTIDVKIVSEIKKRLAKGYKEKHIQEWLKIERNIEVNKSIIASIKNLESFADIETQLNETIVKQISSSLTEYEKTVIGEVKYFIGEGFSKEEIINAYDLSESKFKKIKYLNGVYQLIAPEFNGKLLKITKKKKRITPQMVTQIKGMYVAKNGNIALTEIAKNVDINKSHISRIINLKSHATYGQKFNADIRKILKEEKTLKKNKEQYRKKKIRMKKDLVQLFQQRNKINKTISERKLIIKNIEP